MTEEQQKIYQALMAYYESHRRREFVPQELVEHMEPVFKELGFRQAVRPEEKVNLLVVKDDGIGIPAAEQDKVFERFYRVDKSRSKATGGTGLGLSIVKHIVELHNAKIILDSEPGVGTEIKVVF